MSGAILDLACAVFFAVDVAIFVAHPGNWWNADVAAFMAYLLIAGLAYRS